MPLSPSYTIPLQTKEDIESDFMYKDDNDPLYQIHAGKLGSYKYELFTNTDYLECDCIGKPSDSTFRLLLVKDTNNSEVAMLSYQLGRYTTSTYALKTSREAGSKQPKIERVTPDNAVYINYISVSADLRRQGWAKQLLALQSKLEGNKLVCGYAMNKASAKLMRLPNAASFPEVNQSYDYRWAETWFNTKVRDILKPAIAR